MTEEIRLLSLWQPWASLIAHGLKQYETRSWGTGYRGKIAIQAAKRPVKYEEKEAIVDPLRGKDSESLARLIKLFGTTSFPLGCIVAVADLTGCRQMISAKTTLTEFCQQPQSVQDAQIPIISLTGATPLECAVGDWQPDRFAWKLDNIRPIGEPIPCKGAQGLRVIRDESILAAIEQQLAVTDAIEKQLAVSGGETNG